MLFMNIYINKLQKQNIIYYKLPLDIIKNNYLKKNINIDKLKNTYLFLLILGMITYNRYIL
jgi:hypothetical protein